MAKVESGSAAYHVLHSPNDRNASGYVTWAGWGGVAGSLLPVGAYLVPTIATRFLLTPHAIDEAIRDKVSPAQLVNVLNHGRQFNYLHRGMAWKTGYYIDELKIFVATDSGVVLTVINYSDNPRYVERLIRNTEQTLSVLREFFGG